MVKPPVTCPPSRLLKKYILTHHLDPLPETSLKYPGTNLRRATKQDSRRPRNGRRLSRQPNTSKIANSNAQDPNARNKAQIQSSRNETSRNTSRNEGQNVQETPRNEDLGTKRPKRRARNEGQNALNSRLPLVPMINTEWFILHPNEVNKSKC